MLALYMYIVHLDISPLHSAMLWTPQACEDQLRIYSQIDEHRKCNKLINMT